MILTLIINTNDTNSPFTFFFILLYYLYNMILTLLNANYLFLFKYKQYTTTINCIASYLYISSVYIYFLHLAYYCLRDMFILMLQTVFHFYFYILFLKPI